MSESEVLLPVYHANRGSNVMSALRKSQFLSFDMPLPAVGWTSIALSFTSFFFCVAWSIAYNFEEANATHCSVPNYLPSISAAIGHFYPQIYVWNVSVLVQMIPRLKISTMYLHYHSSVIDDRCFHLCYFAWVLEVCELWALLGLSLLTSTTYYPFHAFCFVTFLLSSMLYMILSCYLLKFKRKIPPGNMESRILKWKFKLCLVNILCFLIAGYFFRRHNVYCEPKVYSIFALFEYFVVVSNILFHLPAVWDFHDKTLTVSLTSRGIHVDYSPPFKSVVYALK